LINLDSTILLVAGGLLAVIIALGIWLAVVQRRMSRLESQYRRLMSGVDGDTLEQALDHILSRVEETLAGLATLEASDRERERTLRSSVQHVGMLRFNPFDDTGGDLSFAVALADADGNGLVLCNLHARGEARLYAKPLAQWRSPYPLSDEETEAVNRARTGRATAEEE
jgi:hypothetical protein